MVGQDDSSLNRLESDEPSESTDASEDARVNRVETLKERVELLQSDETHTKVKVFTLGDGGFGIDGLSEAELPAQGDTATEAGGEQPCPLFEIPDRAETCGAETAANNRLGTADMQRTFERNFERLDTDGDGFVSESEIDQAMVDPCFQGEDAQLLVALKKTRTELEELSNDELLDEDDGITLADMEEFNKLQAREDLDDDEKELVRQVGVQMARTHDSLETASKVGRQLFANKANPLESITPDAVYQGQFNDCYFLAPLASMANSKEGKQAIYNMIKDNDDGTYTVTFPGDPEHPVVVTAPTDAELGAGASASSRGIWVAVIEKAYGRHEDPDAVLAHMGMPDYSKFSTAMELLTGREVDTDNILFTSLSEIHEDLQTAINTGRPVKAFNWTDGNGLTGSHVYSVLDYNPNTQMVKLRNPYGYGEPLDVEGNAKDGDNDGVFEMPLWWFAKNFTTISYGE